MGTVEKTAKAPLPNATPGKTLRGGGRGAAKLVGSVPPINLSGIISNPHQLVEADTQHLHTKTDVGEKCNLRKIAANYVLESLHLVLLANCFEDVPLWVNCVIKPFVN